MAAAAAAAVARAPSAERKQEQPHLRMPRDGAGLPHSRQRLDRDQPGPAYANESNRSVRASLCPSCCHTHRAKSVSMPTFAQQETAFCENMAMKAVNRVGWDHLMIGLPQSPTSGSHEK